MLYIYMLCIYIQELVSINKRVCIVLKIHAVHRTQPINIYHLFQLAHFLQWSLGKQQQPTLSKRS